MASRSIRPTTLVPLLAGVLAIGAARTAHAQHEQHAPGAPASAGAPRSAATSGPASMPLFREALGPFTRRTSTASAEVQGYVDQGFQLVYAFAPGEGARSFREAARRDSTCALCAWGEAWALGPYLNGPMDSAAAPRAYAAARRARALAATRATAAERALIDAMSVRYAPVHVRGERRRLDSAYATAMAAAYAAHPRDPEVGTLYAEALMLLEPRRGRWDAQAPAVRRIHQVLGDVLARDRAHPGACHLYIHATESTTVPARAEACAELLGSAIPGASHINHMPSHTFNRVGRWDDAVRANIAAWHSDQRAGRDGGFSVYPTHNLHMLLFSASMAGQGATATQAAKDLAKLYPESAFYESLVLLRFGRFDEVLALERAPAGVIERGLWEFARGMAHLRVGDPDNARAYLERVERAARTTPDSVTFRGHPAAQLLGVTGGILRGELLRRQGRLPEAIAALERATALEDSLRYDEPEPLNFSARHWLGAALLEAGRAADAERVYRAALDDHPRNGWSLAGLAQALRAQGRTAAAAQTRRELDASWARADTWLTGSRF
jgi:tetratricopeptide (TPR) repeat protein